MIKINQINIKAKWAVGFALLVIYSILFIGLKASVVSAQSVDEVCGDRAKESECAKEYRSECANKDSAGARQSCVNTITRKYKEMVIDECKGKASSEECNKKVEEKCKDKKGKQLEKCREEQAENYSTALTFGSSKGTHQCGTGPDAVKTRINFSCVGNNSSKPLSPVEDIAFAIVRFLSYGVGLVITGSIIVAGIQYTTSEGNAETTQAAKSRIQNAVVGLVVYIFAFSLLQYLVPGGLFAP